MTNSRSTIPFKQNHPDSTNNCNFSNCLRDNPDSTTNCSFSNCLRDTNCKCEMCVASFNATLDLAPNSIKRISLTALPPLKSINLSPIPFHASPLSPPNGRPKSPGSAALVNCDMYKTKIYGKGYRSHWVVLFFLCLALAEIAFPLVVSWVFQPRVSLEFVRKIADDSSSARDIKGKLVFLQKKLKLAGIEPANCSNWGAGWMVNKDGLLLHLKCTLYRSSTEEVDIWGWSLQTSGLLKAGFSSRSFTILSGRIIEWTDEKYTGTARHANSSWVQRKWSESAVYLYPNTWVLEYRKNFFLENSRILLVAVRFLRYGALEVFEGLMQVFWQLHSFLNVLNAEQSYLTPT